MPRAGSSRYHSRRFLPRRIRQLRGDSPRTSRKLRGQNKHQRPQGYGVSWGTVKGLESGPYIMASSAYGEYTLPTTCCAFDTIIRHIPFSQRKKNLRPKQQTICQFNSEQIPTRGTRSPWEGGRSSSTTRGSSTFSLVSKV